MIKQCASCTCRQWPIPGIPLPVTRSPGAPRQFEQSLREGANVHLARIRSAYSVLCLGSCQGSGGTWSAPSSRYRNPGCSVWHSQTLHFLKLSASAASTFPCLCFVGPLHLLHRTPEQFFSTTRDLPGYVTTEQRGSETPSCPTVSLSLPGPASNLSLVAP